MVGAYYGSLVSRRGDFTPIGLNITMQSGRRLLGWIEANARTSRIQISGTVSSAGRIRVKGSGRSPRGGVRMTLEGTVEPDPERRRASLSGTYRIGGAIGERGTFTLTGTYNGGAGR